MRKMLFETNLKGHRMEYIHHIYMGMVSRPETEFIIAVPIEFEERKQLYKWPESSNVRVVLFKKDEVIGLTDDGKSIKVLLRQSRLLRKYIKNEHIDSVFLISLMRYIPFLPLLVTSKVKVCGIIYKIYLYRWKKASWILRIKDILKYWLISRHNCINTAFILNDAPSAHYLNKLYNTDKFRYIVDPYNALDYEPKDVRAMLGIKQPNKIFLHFGGLQRRKGTLTILEALRLISEDELKSFTIIFAGKVYQPIHDEFYSYIETLKSKVNIIIYDQFVSNEFLADLCVTSDFILAPYTGTIQSSGLLGHVANYGTPVIGPSEGLVGKLIKRNHLGIALDNITPASLARSMEDACPYRLNTPYKNEITICNFVKKVFEYL